MEDGITVMIRNISKRIKTALDAGINQEFFNEYLENILENSHRVDEKYYRSILMLILAMASFELFTRGLIAEANIGFFKITDISLLHKYTPIVIAYFIFTSNSLSYLRESLGIAYREGLRILHAPMVDNALWLLLAPSSPILAFQLALTNKKNLLTKAAELIVIIILGLGLSFVPLFFEIYAFYRCFSLFGVYDFHIWISVIISTVFILESLFLIFHRFLLR
jgi:hypothetical protein